MDQVLRILENPGHDNKFAFALKAKKIYIFLLDIIPGVNGLWIPIQVNQYHNYSTWVDRKQQQKTLLPLEQYQPFLLLSILLL